MIADKFFSAQKLLGILHLVGAAMLFFLTKIGNADTFYWIVLLYSLLYAPTLALVNSVAFRQMNDPAKEFPAIRFLGTIGWIATGFLIDKVLKISTEQLSVTFILASVASAVLGLLSFSLPDTPPKAKGTKTSFAQAMGADAMVLFKDKSFVIFFIASVLICIPLAFYYSLTNLFLTDAGMNNATSNMTLGQFSEAFFILLIPFLLRRLGVKWMIAIGMLAWVIRFLFFSYGDAGPNLWMFFAGIILHGVCFDFFFVTGQIYTDSKAGQKIQSSAQGLITMGTYGVGIFIGSLLSGYVKDYYTVEDISNWKNIWMVPAAIAGIVLLLFIILFREKNKSTEIFFKTETQYL